MSILDKLFKPRWQSRDANVRRAAVIEGHDAELVAALPRIARSDADAQVRLAAMKRVADVGLAHSLANDDASQDVRKAAQSQWFDLMSGRHAQAPPLDTRLRLLRAQDDSNLIEHLAEHGKEIELRGAALDSVTRPSVLLDRVLGERDPALRWKLLARIDDEAQLERIAERSRRNDKQLHRRSRERIDAIRLARGDAASIAERARELCERIEKQVRDGKQDDALHEQWRAIAEKAPEALRTRYDSARALLERASDPDHVATLRDRAAAMGQFDNALASLERDIGHASPAQHESLAARMDELADHWSALHESAATQRQSATRRIAAISERLDSLANQHAEHEDAAAARHALKQARVEEQKSTEERAANAAARAAKREQAIVELEATLQTLEKALESGQSSDTEVAHARVELARANVDGELPSGLHKRLGISEAEYADSAQWRNWGANQRRMQLCEEIESLPDAVLHPDALATRLREAQAEWTRVEKALGLDHPDAMSRRFRAACRRAIEPARPYFEKRDELRATATGELEALIERGSALPEEIDDWKTVIASRRELASALRDLDRVDPRQRKALADRIKSGLSAIDERVDARDKAVAERKEALIAKASALSELGDKRAAISTSRDLQKQWQASGNGMRRRDEQQWKQFRAAVDAVFASADAERASIADAERERRDQASTLCEELEQLASADDTPERGSVQRIVDAFSAMVDTDSGLRTRFRNAQDALRLAAQARQQAARRARYDTWLAQWRLCRAVERCELEVDTARDQMTALPTSEIDADLMAERFHAAISGIIGQSADESVFRNAVITFEQFAGIETPEADRQRRLDLQVGQLSARLRGDDRVEPSERLGNLMREWLQLGALPGLPDVLDQRFERAYLAALDRTLST
ncbi:MAG: DUF349 domain-containing protein [Dokdonella sp.]